MTDHPLISYVKLRYTVQTLQHIAILPCKLPAGTPVVGVDPTLFKFDGSYIGSTVGVTAYVTAIKPQFVAANSFDSYEIWSNQGRSDYTWIWGDDLAIAGTSGATTVLTSQMTLTYRTLGGNNMRVQLMELAQAANQRVALKASGVTLGAVVAIYMMGATNWITGRDGTFPAAPIWATTKLNDALRHKRNLA